MVSHGLQRADIEEHPGKAVAGWLNRQGDKKGGERVVALVKQLKELTPRMSYSEWYQKRERGELRDGVYIPAFKRLNEELKKYAKWPQLRWRSFAGPGLSSGKKSIEVVPYVGYGWSSGGKPGATVVHAVVGLAAEGRLSRLLKCAYCKRWCYGRDAHQKFCTTTCRIKHFRSTPEWKESRRLYMRQYRQRERQRDVADIARLNVTSRS